MNKNRALYLILFTTIAVALRFWLASSSQLKLDEVWSVENARTFPNWWHAFVFFHDNNHILNSIYLYFLGHGSWWLQYRFLSVITGTAMVALIGWAGFKRGTLVGIFTLLLSSFSLPLIISSSQARGYAPALFSAVAAFLIFDRYGEKVRPARLLLFWLSIILGVLSHLVFVYVYLGFLFSSLLSSSNGKIETKNRLAQLIKWHLVPSVFMSLLYILYIRNIIFGGGGNVFRAVDRLFMLLIYSLNLPNGPQVSYFIAGGIFVLILIWLFVVERIKTKNWVFFLTVVGIMPIVVMFLPLLFFSPDYLYFSLPFFYLLLASMLVWFMKKGKVQMVLSLFVILFFCFSGIKLFSKQIKFGNGDYIGALKYISEESGPVVNISSDHDARNRKLINFYGPLAIKPNQTINYETDSNHDPVEPEWVILHSIDPKMPPPSGALLNWSDAPYTLKRSFKNADIISGISWYIYKKN